MKTLITNCLLIDGTGKAALRDAWLLINGSVIESTGISGMGIVPEADTIVDACGCAVLPGMFNVHVHIQRRHLHRKAAGATFRQGAPEIENAPDTRRILWASENAWYELTRGVTSIRDCSSKNRINIDLREAIQAGIIQGPRISACGFGIAATGGHETHLYHGAIEADGADEVRKAVRGEIKAGADFIKFMGSGGLGGMPDREDPRWIELGLDELTTGIVEAHNRGKKTTVHAMGKDAVNTALSAGIDGIEHGADLDEHALDFMKEHGIFYVPTLSGIASVSRRVRDSGNIALSEKMDEIVVNPLRSSIREAVRRGILIGTGTDTLGEMVQEIQLLNECGMPEMECILAATRNGAVICGWENILGTLEPGKIADLVMVQGDPLQNLSTLRNVKAVYQSGRPIDRNRTDL